jgi:hypothetical protein
MSKKPDISGTSPSLSNKGGTTRHIFKENNSMRRMFESLSLGRELRGEKTIRPIRDKKQMKKG